MTPTNNGYTVPGEPEQTSTPTNRQRFDAALSTLSRLSVEDIEKKLGSLSFDAGRLRALLVYLRRRGVRRVNAYRPPDAYRPWGALVYRHETFAEEITVPSSVRDYLR